MAVENTTGKPPVCHKHRQLNMDRTRRVEPTTDHIESVVQYQQHRDVKHIRSQEIQVTSHKLEHRREQRSQHSNDIQVTSHKVDNVSEESPSKRLLRRKQEVDTKPPEVYLLDLDEVKVHKVKRIFKIGGKDPDDSPLRCRSEERNRRRTWHPTDTERSTRSDGDVVSGRGQGMEDFTSPLALQERSSRPRQRRSAFMESIHNLFSSRKSTASPSQQGSPPSQQGSPDHVARAQGGMLRNDRLRQLAEGPRPSQGPQGPLTRPRDHSASPLSRRKEVAMFPEQHKSSSLPPNQKAGQPVDNSHVIYDMGDKTFKRFSNYLKANDLPPESRV